MFETCGIRGNTTIVPNWQAFDGFRCHSGLSSIGTARYLPILTGLTLNEDSPSVPLTYTVGQVAKLLQIAPPTVRNKARGGAWPYLEFGPRTIRFTEHHLATILTTSEVAPVQQSPIRRRT